ncbi:hypothetical protein DIURU_002515 [Diutina rugosa]|uniref:F-box domain-containing protein n=1 Tax=Diutina rugosa TaxID=5481 RepID=A0A642UWF0_DIURU|nr:uncharacterized protein DIURU_002515 [Diutina rugosa]KAA8903228.1 hypothetical protein DIURU_002515 [Diutina rugosa]
MTHYDSPMTITTNDNNIEDDSFGCLEPILCDNCFSKLHRLAHRRAEVSPSVRLPLEIVATVLEFLPQHRVHPFLSLSKGVDYIAKQRLFHQVYVLGPDEEPLLHDSIDDLKHWSYLSQSQFLHLMRIKFKWPGEITIIESPRWNDQLLHAIINHLKPAKVSFRITSPTSSAPQEFFVNYRSVMSTPHLYQVVLVEIELESTPTKVRVDSLVIVGNVKGIRGCFDISVVKHFSVRNAQHVGVDNVFHYAPEFSTLRDFCMLPNQTSAQLIFFGSLKP